jgi:hypothetical protein
MEHETDRQQRPDRVHLRFRLAFTLKMSQLLQFAASLTQSGHAPAAGAAGRRNRHQKHRQKICLYYEALFDMAVDEDLGGLNEDGSTTFISTATAGSKGKHRSQQQKPQSRVDWHEMFLLEVNGEHLKTLVKRHNRCPHVLFSQSMQMFLKHCATAGVQPLLSPPERTLPLESADSQTLPLGLQLTVQMLVHCLQTLEALLRAVYSLQPQAPAAFINYFTTLQLADKQFTVCLVVYFGAELNLFRGLLIVYQRHWDMKSTECSWLQLIYWSPSFLGRIILMRTLCFSTF